MHSFTFNGHSSDEFGIRIERFPDLNRSERKYKSASVSGRNGNIYQMESAWEEVTVSYQIFAGERTAGAAVTDFTDIVEWLNSADDYAVLTDTYDPTHYRLAVFVDEMEIESQWHTFGKATVRFRCRPQRFIVESPISVNDGDTITNTTNHIAKPIISMTGNGAKSLLDLTGLSMRSQSTPVGLSINNLQPFIDAKSINSSILWVKKGSNNTTVTYADGSIGGTFNYINNTTGSVNFSPADNNWCVGIVQAVNPDTDYVISISSSSGCRLVLWYGASEGYNNIL